MSRRESIKSQLEKIDWLESNLDEKTKKWIEECDNEMRGMAGQISQDSSEWMDRVMKVILPPDIYDKAMRLEDLDYLHNYFHANQISLVQIPDTLRWELRVKGKLISSFRPIITAHGEPVERKKLPGGFLPDSGDLTSN